jgi:hypothetical protein
LGVDAVRRGAFVPFLLSSLFTSSPVMPSKSAFFGVLPFGSGILSKKKKPPFFGAVLRVVFQSVKKAQAVKPAPVFVLPFYFFVYVLDRFKNRRDPFRLAWIRQHVRHRCAVSVCLADFVKVF